MKYLLIFLLLLHSFYLYAEDITNIKLISIYDGDTFKISILDSKYDVFGKNISVRAFGIDTPEIKGKTAKERLLALKAKQFTKEFLSKGKIVLKDVQRDKYFRILAKVFVTTPDGKELELSNALIKQGLAREYYGDKKQSWN